MIELELNNIKKNYGLKNVLDGVNFEVKTGERISLIGENGTGKSTILKIINREEKQDEGTINIRNNSTIGYLKQFYNKEQENLIVEQYLKRSFEKYTEIETKLKELENVIEKDVEKYTIYKEEIYVICGENQELKRFNPDTKELEDLNQNSIVEILVDDDYIFAVKDLKTKKVLLRINKDGNDLKELVNDQNVSYIIQDMNSIYYVNKADEDKIYTVSKEGTDNEKLADICSNSDSGDLKEIDGSKYMVVNMGYLYYINSKENYNLWKLNLATKDNSKEISVPVEILQNVDGTLFYKMKNEMGVYLYNLESKFMSQVTKRKVKEFRVGEKIAEEDIKYDGNILKN